MQLIDGSYHNVDSDEHSFRAAGRKAFRAAMEKVKPSILEPIMDVEIAAPQEYSGDIMGDLNSRRGRVQGMETSGKQQVIKAQVPMAEMLNYQSTLNSITAARGSFHMQFSHYDPVPGNLAQKIVEQSRAEGRIQGRRRRGINYSITRNSMGHEIKLVAHFFSGCDLTAQVICWDRGRLARTRRISLGRSKVLLNPFSRFALIAGETPAVPANHLCGFSRSQNAFPVVIE